MLMRSADIETSKADGTVRIRRAILDDAPALSALAQRLFEQTYLAANNPRNVKAYVSTAFTTDAQRAELNDQQRRYIVCDNGPEMVAYALLRTDSKQSLVQGAQQVELERFYVDGTLHGGGVAHALMDEVLVTAMETGADSMWLDVWEHNPRAIAFYGKRGFVDAGTSTFELGDEKQTDRIMWRFLQLAPTNQVPSR